MAPSKSELIDSAQRNAQKGQLDKAIKDYQQALQLDAGDIQTRLRLGDVFVKKGATRDAIEQYFRVAERHAGDGFYLKAIAVHKQILKLDSAHIDSSARLADLYHKQGLLSDALAAYQQVAAVYDRKGAVREALDTLTKMADLDPHNVAIRVKLGELYLKASIKESGIEQLLKAAELYGQSGKSAEQGRILEKVLASGPLSKAATRSVIAALVAAGQADAALKKLAGLVAKAPDDPELRELEADACLKVGETDRAMAALAAAVESSPQRVEARQRLVELHLDAGDDVGAAAAAEGFTPDSVPPNRLGAATAAVSAILARHPAPADLVQVALYRRLAELEGARNDAAGRQAALAALGALTGEVPGPATVDAGGDLSLEAIVDGGTVDQPVRATPLEAQLEPVSEEEAPAELTIEIEGDEAQPEPPGDAMLLEGATVDRGGFPYTVDGGMGGVALDSAPLDAPGPSPARPLPGAPQSSARQRQDGPHSSSSLDLSLELDAGLDTAPLDALPIDMAPLDPMPLDTPTVDAAGRGDDAPLEGAAAVARARATGSPEARVLAAGDVELALDQIPEELDEAEFFVQQGLLDAARAIYKRILDVDPEHPAAIERLERLEAGGKKQGAHASARPGVASPSPGRPSPGGPHRSARPGGPSPSPARELEDAHEQFDLAAVLTGSPGGSAAGLLGDPEEQVSFQEVFREFKKGVERQVGDDPETHYNLGIAYKEMGLIEDAIAEFERALGDPRRTFDCYTMIGLAHLARGDAGAAIAAFEGGLAHAGEDGRQTVALTYELGAALEAAGRADDARGAFATVAASDPGFRDVAERLAALGGMPAGGAANGVFDPQSLLEEDLDFASTEPGAPHRSPGRLEPAAPRGSVTGPPRSPGGKPGVRDRISFV